MLFSWIKKWGEQHIVWVGLGETAQELSSIPSWINSAGVRGVQTTQNDSYIDAHGSQVNKIFLEPLESFNQKEFLRFAVSYMVFEESVMALALHDTKLVTFLILSCEEKIKFAS